MANYGTKIDKKWPKNGKKQTFINLIKITLAKSYMSLKCSLIHREAIFMLGTGLTTVL